MSLFPGRRLIRTGLLPLAALGFAVTAAGDPPSGFVVAPTSREQTRVLYNTIYQASENVPSGWTGNVANGVAGTTSAAFKDAIKLRVNYFRAMAGVPSTVVFSDFFNSEDQQAALISSANQLLSHTLSVGLLDFTLAGADAATHSNLALGTSEDGPQAIDDYMSDFGSANTAAGHRRWIIYPPETTMGTGDVDLSGTFLAANALWILDQASFASPEPAARDGFVAWPPPGYIPYQLVPTRWSLSYPGADFSAAFVTMSRKGNALPVQLEALTSGAGDNTLVWIPNGADPTVPPTPVVPAKEAPTTVNVYGVLINGSSQTFTYTVTPFNPSVPGADTVYPTVSGSTQPGVGAASTYTFNAVPNATGYHWQAGAITPFTLDLDAENGPGDVTITPAGTSLITTTQAANGQASYQFASQPPETMEVNAAFVPQAGAALAFNSQLDYASTDETASAQISTDSGVTWTNLYSITGAGTSSPTETGFAPHSVDLSAYAGKNCYLRFQFAYDGSGVYFPRNTGTGWFVDDITVTGAQAVSAAPVSGDLTAGQLSFVFTPATAGTYALQVVPVFFGQYAADAGPVLTVTTSKGGGNATPTPTPTLTPTPTPTPALTPTPTPGTTPTPTPTPGTTPTPTPTPTPGTTPTPTPGTTPTPTPAPGTTPTPTPAAATTVTVSATTAVANVSDGSSGVFTLTRAGSDLSQKIQVHYTLKGSAVNGTDYELLSGKVKMKANKASTTVSVVPQAGGGTGKVKLVVQPGNGYSVGSPASASIKIKP